ncbi:MAG: hypothetical protein WC054_00950 [Candidatus Nanopelagicales bacterium]
MVTNVEELTISDTEIVSFMASAEEDFTVGVQFDPLGRVYTYLAPTSTRVGNWVLVPANSFRHNPSEARVVVLNPSPPPGVCLARIIKVLF